MIENQILFSSTDNNEKSLDDWLKSTSVADFRRLITLQLDCYVNEIMTKEIINKVSMQILDAFIFDLNKK